MIGMATKETRVQRGRRRGRSLLSRAILELHAARAANGLSQQALARHAGSSSSAIGRLLANERRDVGVVELSQVASVLGYEVSLNLYPVGDALRDRGQLRVGQRFDARLCDAWRVTNETLLPGAGEQRAWDKLLRLVGSVPPHLVGVDIETRVHDIQALVRRTRARERDGQVDAILIVLADTHHNRRFADELRAVLGAAYATAASAIFRALRTGTALPGSGVVLV
jgi:transcriptional regulator with XRE-family HTH domain